MQKLKGQEYCFAMLRYVDPFVAILISAIILQEQMTIVQMLGGALLLGSTFVSENKSITFSKTSNVQKQWGAFVTYCFVSFAA